MSLYYEAGLQHASKEKRFRLCLSLETAPESFLMPALAPSLFPWRGKKGKKERELWRRTKSDQISVLLKVGVLCSRNGANLVTLDTRIEREGGGGRPKPSPPPSFPGLVAKSRSTYKLGRQGWQFSGEAYELYLLVAGILLQLYCIICVDLYNRVARMYHNLSNSYSTSNKVPPSVLNCCTYT